MRIKSDKKKNIRERGRERLVSPAQLLWVSIDGSQREVEVSSLRCGFDLVAIFGEQQQRAMVQLALMSDCWSRATGCFGEDSTLALGPREARVLTESLSKHHMFGG